MAEGTLAEIEAAVVEAVEISAEGAARSAQAVVDAGGGVAGGEVAGEGVPGEGKGITRVVSKGSLQGNVSSVGAEAGSSVGAPENVAELQVNSWFPPFFRPKCVEVRYVRVRCGWCGLAGGSGA